LFTAFLPTRRGEECVSAAGADGEDFDAARGSGGKGGREEIIYCQRRRT